MQNITVKEVRERLANGESLHILDVREPDEYAQYNIGGKLIPLGVIQNMDIEEIEAWKEDEVIVHCRSGKRSMTACLVLETLGFTNTKNLEGGMLSWQEADSAVK